MGLPIDTQASKAVIIGIEKYPKEDTWADLLGVPENTKNISALFSNPEKFGISETSISILDAGADNIQIKEVIATAAEQCKGTLYLYYSGVMVIRKGKLFMGSQQSTLNHVHINGIPLDEIISLSNEGNAKNVVVLIEADFHKASEEFAFETDALLKEIFLSFERNFPNIVFLSASANKPAPMPLGAERQMFTNALLELIEEGIEKNSASLSFADVFQAVSAKLGKGVDPKLPICGRDPEKVGVAVFPNNRFISFDKLKEKADALFGSGEYQEAVEPLKQAQELYPAEKAISDKLAYINSYLAAQDHYKEDRFQEAKDQYKAAYEIINEASALAGMKSSLEKLGNRYFEEDQFEAAKKAYEELVQLDDENKFYRQRLQITKDEIAFGELVDAGDKAYFTDHYQEALKFYEEALTINRDTKVLKRKEECEKFLQREKQIRINLEKEITEKLKNEVEEKLRSEVEQKKGEIQQEIRSEVEQTYKQEMEDSFWARVCAWNNIDAYQFYKGFFPNGKHLEKADKRIDELKKMEAEQAVTSPSSQTEVASTVEQQEVPKPSAEKVSKKVESASEASESIQKEAKRIRLSEALQREDVQEAIPKAEEKAQTAQENASQAEQEEVVPVPDPPKVEKTPVKQVITEESTEDFNGMSEEELWSYAIQTGTIKSFMHYIENTSEYTHVADAYYEINQLKQQGADDQVEASESPKQQEITKEEKANSVTEARDVPAPKSISSPKSDFSQMSEDELWEYAQQENTAEAYKTYVEYTKESMHVADAYYLINQVNSGKSIPESTPEPEKTSEVELQEPSFDETPPAQPEEIEETEEEATEEPQLVPPSVDYSDELKEIEENHALLPEDEIDKISNFSEEDLWNYIIKKNKLEGYRTYIEISKEGKYLADAYYNINQLSHIGDPVYSDYSLDIDTVNTTTNEPQKPDPEPSSQAVSAPRDAESRPPVSRSKATETAKVSDFLEDSLSENDLWARATAENTIGAYFNYLNTTTEKKHWEEAKKRINELKNDSQEKEQADWESAQLEDSVDAYKNYIRKYPLGSYYAKAMFRLKKLEEEK